MIERTGKNGSLDRPRILLLSGTIPGEAGVGEIILRDECNELSPGQVRCIAFVPRTAGARESAERCPEVVRVFDRRYETSWRPLSGLAGGVISSLAFRAKSRPYLRRLASEVVEIAREQQVDMVWAVLDCPTVILLAQEVAQRLGKPLAVLVWDAPELFCEQLGHDRWTRRTVLNAFERVMRSASRCAVVGESMKTAYDAAFGQDCVIVRHGLSKKVSATPLSARPDRNEWVIGFAGSLTASDAFNRLVAALDSVAWRIADREVVLRIVGARYLLEPHGPRRIEYYGWRSVPETLALMADTDLLYLPQPFSDAYRSLASLSFPTKLSTYLPAGRPILLHAPSYASLVPFFQRYPFGARCESLEPVPIVDALSKLLTDEALGRQAVAAGRAAFDEELNSTVFRARFKEFLGV